MNDPRALLRELEMAARKRFGQHFLTREDVVLRMVRAAAVKPGDRVVEIGPGLGILTNAILDAGGELVAVELDRDLAAWQRAHYGDRVRLIEADAAQVHWAEALPGSGWKMVANLPYNVGTGIVLDALRLPGIFESVTVMLQKEVVMRLCAPPGNKVYGATSVLAQARGEVRYLFPVAPGSFHPPPKVDSAVVMVRLYAEPHVGPAGEAAFERVVRAAFSQRRKTLHNALTPLYGRERAAAALVRAGIDPGARAETLDGKQFAALAAAMYEATPPQLG